MRQPSRRREILFLREILCSREILSPREILAPLGREILALREILRPRRAFAVVALAAATACGGDADATRAAAAPDTTPAAAAAAAAPAHGAHAADDAALVLTAADLDAWERGREREIALVRAARARGRAATTPAERAAAAQAEWEDATIPDAARSVGLAEADYRRVRETVDRVLETLDFQGAIDGPLELDTTRASPEARARLTEDPYAALPAATADAIRARLPRLVVLWNAYAGLTALNG